MAENTENKQTNKNKIELTVIIVSLILTIAAVISVLLLLGMNESYTVTESNYTAHEITDRIIRSMNYDNLSEISAENIYKYYDIPEGTISDSAMYISSKPDSFTEIACFRLRSEDVEDKMISSANNYISEKMASYKNVNDKAYEAVSNSRILCHYPYIVVTVSTDNSYVESVFESIFTDDKIISELQSSSLNASEIKERGSVVELSVDESNE